MKRALQLALILLVTGISVSAQNLAWNGFCQDGGVKVQTSGLSSTTKVQASYPQCTVTVYFTGTTVIAPIYTNGTGSPLANPFQANTDGSILLFAASTACYDIVTSASTSGGTPAMPTPFTYTDVCLGSGGGGGTVVNPFLPIPNCTAAGTVLNETVQLSTQVISGVTQVCATIGAISSTTVIGVCNSACGNTGIAQVAFESFQNAIMDNTATANDYVAPSSTVAGFLTDTGVAFGTAAPNPPVETCGIVGTPNSGGAGNAANVMLNCLALFGGGPTGTGTVSLCPLGTTPGAIGYYPTIPGTNIACDASFRTDGHGNVVAVSLGLTGSGAGFLYQTQGAAPTLSALNSTYWYAATSVASTWGCSWPASLGSTNQILSISGVSGSACTTSWTSPAASVSITATSPIVVTPSPLTGTGVVSCPTCGTSTLAVQTNGTPNASQSTLNFQNGPSVNGITINPSNPSGGNEQMQLSGALPTFSQVPQPATPTCTVNGTTGSTTITYAVVAVQDTAGTQHTQASAVCTVTTANATLTNTNSITLSGYQMATNGTSVRCWNIYRVSTNGTSPTTTGLIASCVDTKFLDGGLAGDSTTAPNTNTTVLQSNPQPLPGCPAAVGGVFGIDAPPCTTTATDDEFTWTGGGTFNIADTNDPKWVWVNQNSATATLSNGMVELSAPGRGGADNLNCIMQIAPSTPYSYVGVWYANGLAASTTIQRAGMLAFYESATGKLVTINTQLTQTTSKALYIEVDSWTNTTTLSSSGTGFFNSVALNGYYFKIQNDGTNLNFFSSPDGIFYTLQATQAKAAFFTTGPNEVGLCVDANTNAGTVDWDYFRRVQ